MKPVATNMAERDLPIWNGAGAVRYDQDYAAWLDAQIGFLRERKFSQLDLDNLLDEVASLRRWNWELFRDAVKMVIRQMLTWDVREDERCRDWAQRIELDRSAMLQELKGSTSFADRREDAIAEAYELARFEMSQGDKLPFRLFPEQCPYSWQDIATREHPLTRDPQPAFTPYKS